MKRMKIILINQIKILKKKLANNFKMQKKSGGKLEEVKLLNND